MKELVISLVFLVFSVVTIIWWVHRRPTSNSVFRVHAHPCPLCGRFVGHNSDCATQKKEDSL